MDTSCKGFIALVIVTLALIGPMATAQEKMGPFRAHAILELAVGATESEITESFAEKSKSIPRTLSEDERMRISSLLWEARKTAIAFVHSDLWTQRQMLVDEPDTDPCDTLF